MISKRQLARGRMPDGQPNPLDVHIGNRLRLRRVYLGITQKDLATLAGISHQQIQQYEIGGNRISAQRLWIFSRLLNVPVGFFFEDMDKEMIAKVFSMLPVSDFRDLCIDECKIEERSDIQELGSAYMRYYSQAKVAQDRRTMAKLNGMFLVPDPQPPQTACGMFPAVDRRNIAHSRPRRRSFPACLPGNKTCRLEVRCPLL